MKNIKELIIKLKHARYKRLIGNMPISDLLIILNDKGVETNIHFRKKGEYPVLLFGHGNLIHRGYYNPDKNSYGVEIRGIIDENKKPSFGKEFTGDIDTDTIPILRLDFKRKEGVVMFIDQLKHVHDVWDEYHKGEKESK